MKNPTDIHGVRDDKTSVMLNDGTILPIVHWYDEHGNETVEPEEAVSFIAGTEGFWVSDIFSAYDFEDEDEDED